MIFIVVAILAQLFYALAFVGDKFVIERSIIHPSVYAFLLNLFGGAGALFWLFDRKLPDSRTALLGIAAGIFFAIGAYLYFTSLKRNAASVIIPLFGSISAIFTVFLSLMLGEKINALQFIGISLLIISIFIFGTAEEITTKTFRNRSISNRIDHANILLAGIFMAISVILYNLAAKSHGFFISFSIVRLSAAGFALLFLFSKLFRNYLQLEIARRRSKLQKISILSRALGACGNVLAALAISIGSPSIVQSMQGVQYIFILPLSIMAGKKFPKVFSESLKSKNINIKIFAIILIAAGLAFISYNL